MKFTFIAKHRVIWPAGWLCGALGVSRGGFYAWLTRPRSQRSRSDEELSAKVRASFLASDRTYGASWVATSFFQTKHALSSIHACSSSVLVGYDGVDRLREDFGFIVAPLRSNDETWCLY